MEEFYKNNNLKLNRNMVVVHSFNLNYIIIEKIKKEERMLI